MGSLTVMRNERVVLFAVTWVDDVQVECAGPNGVYSVRVTHDYQHAHARLVLRRGPNEMILAPDLGGRWSYTGRHALVDGDEVVLQYRAQTSRRGAESEIAELTIEEVADQFEG